MNYANEDDVINKYVEDCEAQDTEQLRQRYLAANERRARFTEGDTVYIVTGRNNIMNSICLYAFTSREAAELWANEAGLNDSDDWVINEVPLRNLSAA
jgi:hypothetical protein